MIEIPGYNILGQVGRGGMATVYRARQILLDREIALKVMSNHLASDPTYSQRFLQEARMLAALNHPHIVQVYDIGETPAGLNYFSMQLLDGGDFAERLRDGMSEQELVRVLVAVAQALGFAHARGYVHRDVTPANILFDAHNQPVLTDFGIARALAATSRITSAGLSIGTSQYMSPEQARGAEVDHRSDIYSLGVICFEAVAGHPPFQGDDGFAVAFSHVHDPVPRLPEEVARWQPLIDRAMAKEPADRFADCQAFIDGLRAVAPEEFAANFGGIVQQVARKPSRKSEAPAAGAGQRRTPWLPLALGLGAIASGGLLAFGIWSWLSEPARPASAPAPTVTTLTTPASTPASPEPSAVAVVENSVDPADEVVALDADETPDDLSEELEPPTVIDPLPELLRMGRINLQQGRLSSPRPNNAFDRFGLALQVAPGNADALAGIAEVARALIGNVRAIDANADTTAWLAAFTEAERVSSSLADNEPLSAELSELRTEALAARVGAGEDALADWNAAGAKRAFADALAIAPGDAAAQRGIERAGKLGKLGYQFADGAGPAMVVVGDSLALGSREITVAQFRVYWNAAGKAKFGKELPNCRNREASGFGSLFSSGKLSWDKPGFAQQDTHPVVCVSHSMAEHYVQWLAAETGKPYRLPSADELQAVLTVSKSCQDNLRDLSFKRDADKRGGVDCDDGHPATAAVGTYAANRSGLFDTGGNVREWTSDCAGIRCGERVAVGLSWETDDLSQLRKNFPADTGSNTIGIRIARDISYKGAKP